MNIRLATTFFERLVGLLPSGGSSYHSWKGTALLISPCRSIHTLGMKVPIDIAFLDKDGAVLKVHRAVRPGVFRITAPGAHSVLERVADAGSPWCNEGQHIELQCTDDELQCADDLLRR